MYVLLGRAVSAADGAAAARAAIDRFVEEFGIVTATEILARQPLYPMVDEAAVVAASAGLRSEVLALCVRDLTSDVSAEGPEALTLLHFVRYLDDDLWKSLQARARQLLDDETADLADLAARFVVIQPQAFGGSGQDEFLEDEFSRRLPRDEWGDYEIPKYTNDDVNVKDASLRSRVVYAAVYLALAVRNPS